MALPSRAVPVADSSPSPSPPSLPNLPRLGARQINSPLGVYNGDVYKVYFDRVRESNPHETTHPCTFGARSSRRTHSLTLCFALPLFSQPPDTLVTRTDFDRIIKPLLEREPLELDDAEEMELDDEIAEMRSEREEAQAEQKKIKEE